MPRLLAPVQKPLVVLYLLVTFIAGGALLPVVPMAQAQDQVGIFWDAGYTTDVASTASVPGALTGYLVLSNPTGSGGVLGWEACVDVQGPGTIVGWDFQGQAVNVGQAPCLAVGYTTPLPPAANILLATFTAIANDTGPIELTMKPRWNPSLPGEMSYIPGDAPGDLIAMRTRTGREVVAGLNGGNPWLTLSATTLDFGAPALGDTTSLQLVISNDGPDPVTVEPQVQALCDFFGLPGGSGPFTVASNDSLVIAVTFSPVQERQVICTLDLGTNLPVISLVGAGSVPVTDWYISGTGHFGNVTIGAQATRSVRLSNTGQTVIPLNAAFTDSCPEFTLTSGGGVHDLQPGDSVLFLVDFRPTSLGYRFCHLDLGNAEIGSITFDGYGIPPVIDWDAPSSYDFLGQHVGLPVAAGLTITNTGSSDFDVIATLPGNCTAFAILQGGGYVHTLTPGQSHSLLVEFNPPATGPFTCLLDLGAVVPGIALRGDGIAAAGAVTATPTQLVFPGTLLGLDATRDVILTSTVNYDVPLAVEIAAPDSIFTIAAGGGEQVLGAGASRTVTVRFKPDAVADYNNALSLGGDLDPVPLQGSGYAGSPECRIEPTALNFGTVALGSFAERQVTITNDGLDPLLLELSTTNAAFFIDEPPSQLTSGQQRTVTVRYQPTALGNDSGALLLGSTACNLVALLGSATVAAGDFSVAPDSVDFGVVGLGVTTDREIVVTNNSPGIIDVNVQLQAPINGFSLLQGDGPGSLLPGDALTIVVRFLSLTPQVFATNIQLGTGLPLVPLSAESRLILPDCELSAGNLNFAEIVIGTTRTDSVMVTNNSGADLVLTPVSDTPEFAVTGGPIVLAAGEAHALAVSFTPQDAIAYSGSINLGPAACADIGCFGSGIPGQQPGQDILGIYFDNQYQQTVAFAESVGQVIPGFLVLSNPSNTGGVLGWESRIELTGGAMISAWSLAGQAVNVGTEPEFIVGLGSPLPFTDDVVLASFTSTVTSLDQGAVFHAGPVLAPSIPGEMGWIPGDLPNALLPMRTALGEPEVAYIQSSLISVSPDTVDIPAVAVGTIVDRQILVTNQSAGLVALNVQLQEPTYGFTLLQGSGQHSLAPGETHAILLRFECLTPQTYATALNLGAGLPPVPIFAVGVFVQPDCIISDVSLNFGSVGIGTGEWHAVSVTNNSGGLMVLTPTSDNPVFQVAQDTVAIQPDSTGIVSIGFIPVNTEASSGIIDLGTGLCGDIACSGIGVPAQSIGTDQLGIYFDNNYYENFAFAHSIGQVIEGYLVLSHPSNTGGVLGWECKVDLAGPATFLAWSLAGQTLNLRTAPEFIVGLNEPLPYFDNALLATFQCLLSGLDQDVILSVLPVSTPSLPNAMAWIPGDLPGALLPMRSVLGQPEVAFITTSVLGTLAQIPEATVLAGQVDLSWPRPLALNEGCHVYRRLDGADTERLTATPINATGQRFVFTDATAGLPPGSTVAYSYAIVRDGQELARSEEVEVTLPGVPVTVTRLLPNVPNPFNPMTEIRFELHRAQAVSLRIYDITGRLVRDLVNSDLPAGPHARIWQGRDNRGRQVPSGAYYVRLVTEGKVDKSKIMLLK